MVIDMTKGRPLPLIARFSAPILFTSIFQQLYSLADGVIAGRFLGINAFAAISAAGFIAWLPQNMLLGLSHGNGIVLSQLFGAGDETGFRRAEKRSAAVNAVFALLFAAVLIVFCGRLLELLDMPGELMQYAREYLPVIYAGLIFFAMFNWAASALRAVGDSRTPFIATSLSMAVNIALDLVFIKLMNMGVIGAALSTAIGQALAFVWCLSALRMKKVDFPARSGERTDDSLMQLLRMGLPPMLRDGVIAVGGLFVQRAINGFGVVFVAGMAAANRYFTVISMSGACLEGAAATFSGQNFGAGRYGRIRSGMRVTLILSMVLAAVSMTASWLAAPQLIGVITGREAAEVLETGAYALRCSILFLPALHVLYIYRAAIQGMGESVTPMLSGFAELAMRLFSVLVLAAHMGRTAACMADGLGWLLAAALLAGRYAMLIRRYCGGKDPGIY